MIDSCIVRLPPTVGAFDPETGEQGSIPGAVLYSGKCKAQAFRGAYETVTEAGGHQYTLRRSELHLPADSASLPPDAIAEITASPMNPQRVGSMSTIAGSLEVKTFNTADRYGVFQVVS